MVFGKANGDPVDLSQLGPGGFLIEGTVFGDYAGRSVSAAGDVNGDGLNDVIIGVPRRDPSGRGNAGAGYVVFGKANNTAVDLAALGTGGFEIWGSNPGDNAGFSVSGAGDVNGDGLDDVVIGAYLADPGGVTQAGESYVVFGKADSATVDLSALGTGGFRIVGIDNTDWSGRSVSGAGDVNGDGLDDLIIGAPQADPGGNSRAGESFVVFGKADNADVNLAALGASGFRIDGIDPDDRSGHSVAGAGDVNGDGLGDLVIGAWLADRGGDLEHGESYVVFGKADTTAVDLAALGAGGFRIDGIDAGDRSGHSVDGAGDVNGDGLDDLIIGAYPADPGDKTDAGESYLVFGKADSTPIELGALGARGFRIDGIDPFDRSGFSVSSAGDVNGDGLADVVIGAPRGAPGGNTYAGESYVVFGREAATASSIPLPADLSAGDRFGGAVATDGNLFVVGLPNADVGSADSGRVVVYRLEGAKLIEDQVIDVPSTHTATNFGGALALEGNRLVIGAPGTVPSKAKGPIAPLQAAIFERLNDGTWTIKDSLTPTNGNDGDEFGASVALVGSRVVVGAPGDADGMDSGAAYVFEIDEGGNMVASRKLKPDNGNSGARFGASVAAKGCRMAVGAPGGKPAGALNAPGLAQVFDQICGNFTDIVPMNPVTNSGNDGDGFGGSVALSDNVLVVGAPGEDGDGGTVDRGAVYAYNPQTVSQMGRLEPTLPAENNAEFGSSVAVNARTIAAGVPGLDAGAGGAVEFDSATLQQQVLSRATLGQRAFGASIALSEDGVVIGAPESDSSAGTAVVQRNFAVIYGSGFE
ncbi:MAG: hypothetical protein R3200_12335 [Xanthomonadales bacterium]|nr:hypothetical protein [Xanthomonadales bacterium]